MVQRRERVLKPLPDSKTQEEKENEETGFINVLNPGNTGLVAGGPPPSPPSPLATPQIGPREPMAPPLYDEGWISPSNTHLDTPFVQGASLSRARIKHQNKQPEGHHTQGL